MDKETAVEKLAELSSPKNTRLKWHLLINKTTGNIVAATRGYGSAPVDPNIEFIPSWQVFEDANNVDAIKKLIVKYKVDLPKKINKLEASLFVWDEMCTRATIDPQEVTNLSTTKSVGVPKHKLANRQYEMIVMTSQDMLDRDTKSLIIPPQAKACLKVMQDLKRDIIPEDELKAKITEFADQLHTRQDPWRIFQYYRASLINLRWFRMM